MQQKDFSKAELPEAAQNIAGRGRKKFKQISYKHKRL